MNRRDDDTFKSLFNRVSRNILTTYEIIYWVSCDKQTPNLELENNDVSD